MVPPPWRRDRPKVSKMQPLPLIAVVDDDALVRGSMTRLLRSMGYEAVAFDSAEQFLAATLADFACLISDMQMPGLNGLGLQRRLAVARPELPIIFMTAFPDAQTRERALAAGARCYLEKPCSADDLSQCLHAILGGERHDHT